MTHIRVENPSINMLHGYLSCLATLCGSRFSFSASSFEDPREIDVFVAELVKEWNAGDEYEAASQYRYGGSEVIDYRAMQREVAKFVFNGELKSFYSESEGGGTVGGEILWRLFEHYGLASTSLNPNGVFHPLVQGPVHRLDIRNAEHAAALYLLVQIEGMYVLTSFWEWRVRAE